VLHVRGFDDPMFLGADGISSGSSNVSLLPEPEDNQKQFGCPAIIPARWLTETRR